MSEFALHQIGGVKHNGAQLDFVFIHGLGGDAFSTWGRNDDVAPQFWPDWLVEAYPNSRVWSLDHPAGKIASIWTGEGMDLLMRSAAALDALHARGIGSHPGVIFITHSLGGLVAKCILRKAKDSSEPQKRKIFENVLGVVFLATPHNGADLAATIKRIPFLSSVVTSSVSDLKPGTAVLDLGQWYRNVIDHGKTKTKAFYETQKIYGVMVVDQASADPAVPGCDAVPVNCDHLGICKFSSPDDETYLSIKSFIDQIVHDNKIDLYTDNEEFSIYHSSVDGDRRDLEQKLRDAGRQDEISYANREKERIAKVLTRNALSPSARREYGSYLGAILSRFRLGVRPAILAGKDVSAVNELFQEKVIDEIMSHEGPSGHPLANQSDIHASAYYLTGNCHIEWDKKDV